MSESKIVNANLSWIPFEQGGRKHPPTGSLYSTVVKFDGFPMEYKGSAWSLVVEFSGANRTEVRVRFLSSDAPEELLLPGRKFELLEGRRVVARGLVTSEVFEQ